MRKSWVPSYSVASSRLKNPSYSAVSSGVICARKLISSVVVVIMRRILKNEFIFVEKKMNLFLPLMSSLHCISTGIAEIVSPTEHEFPTTLPTDCRLGFSLDLMVEFNVIFVLDFPMTKIVVVVCCHNFQRTLHDF